MAAIKKELKARLDAMTDALDNAGETLVNVREKLVELRREIGEDEFERQQAEKNPSPEFLKYVSVEVWANTFEGLIQQFGTYEQKLRSDLRTKTVESMQSIREWFHEILDGLTELMVGFAERLWAMVMKKAREVMDAALGMWEIIKNNPGELAAFLFGAAVGGAAVGHAGAAHFGFTVGAVHITSGGLALVAGLVALGVFMACKCAYRWTSGKIQEYAELKTEVDRLKESVDKVLICEDLCTGIRKTKEDMFHQMDVYESKFLQCDDAS